MMKINEWSSKLHVEQLPSKKREKNFRPPVQLTPVLSGILNTPPILISKERYFFSEGQTNVEINLVLQAEPKMSANQALDEKTQGLLTFWESNPSTFIWWQTRVSQTPPVLQIFLKDEFGNFQRNKIDAFYQLAVILQAT